MNVDRRGVMGDWAAGLAAAAVLAPQASLADEGVPGASYQVVGSSMPLGLGNMAGKTRPDNGVVFWGDSVATMDANNVLKAELQDGAGGILTAQFTSAKLKMAQGAAFDVEVRDKQNGDSVFLMMAKAPSGVTSADALKDSFLTTQVLKGDGRFGAYGAPTDIKVKGGSLNNGYKELEFTFSALSPTYAEVPRRAVVLATIPEGSPDVVMLVGGSTAARWSKGAEPVIRDVLGTFSVSRRMPRNKGA